MRPLVRATPPPHILPCSAKGQTSFWPRAASVQSEGHQCREYTWTVLGPATCHSAPSFLAPQAAGVRAECHRCSPGWRAGGRIGRAIADGAGEAANASQGMVAMGEWPASVRVMESQSPGSRLVSRHKPAAVGCFCKTNFSLILCARPLPAIGQPVFEWSDNDIER